MKGRELQEIQNKMAISPEKVCSEADVSMSTLYKVYGDLHVRPKSRSKVKNALLKLYAQYKSQGFTGAPCKATGT